MKDPILWMIVLSVAIFIILGNLFATVEEESWKKGIEERIMMLEERTK